MLRDGGAATRPAASGRVASRPAPSSVVSRRRGDAALDRRRSAGGVLSIVTATRNGVRVPLASSSSPARTCRPSASAPVAKVSSLPEIDGAGAAAPSSSAPGAVTGSLAVSTIWLADVETEPSAGRRGDERAAPCCRSGRSPGPTASRDCRARRSRSRAGRRGRRRARPCRAAAPNGAVVSDAISVQVPRTGRARRRMRRGRRRRRCVAPSDDGAGDARRRDR